MTAKQLDRPRSAAPSRAVPPIRIGLVKALFRYVKDPKASVLGKAFIVLCFAYVVMPLDFIPDLVPVIGWLDDIGAIAIALTYLSQVLGPYRDGIAGVEPDKQLTE